MGFLDVDRLIALCRTNEWETYKIWQAVKNGDLEYTPVTFLRDTTTLRDARKIMLMQVTKFAVVKKGSREVGMLGMARLTETLNRGSRSPEDEESKDESYLDFMKGKVFGRGGRHKGAAALDSSDPSYENLGNVQNMSTNVTSAFRTPRARISKDVHGNELSRISRKAEVDQTQSLDEEDRIDIETISQIEQQSSARTDTSQFDRERNEEFKDFGSLDNKTRENRLAQSERVKSSSKSTSYYNYLNNRLSVRIKEQYGMGKKQKVEPSLARRLLGSYDNDGIREEKDGEYADLADLENPLLDPTD